jgi:predicted phosphate transport protein (TIGR00153 family)
MSIIDKFFSQSPFIALYEHTKKVHKCVELLRPLVQALMADEYDKINELHHEMSKTEHEADLIKTELRDKINKMYFLSVGRQELSRFLANQDDIADAAEDFAVILTLRKTNVPEELREDFMALVEQVITVSEHLMSLSEELSNLAEAGFAGEQVQKVFEGIIKISEEEWQADKLARKFARHFYSIEKELDPITIIFLEKYCGALSAVANNAEKAAKYLRLVIRKK